MSWPAGRWLVGLAGGLVIALALAQFYTHTVHTDFMYRLDRRQMSHRIESGVERAGRAGYGARAIVLAIAGLFLLVAAVDHDPREAIGLSGALRVIAQQQWGELALWAVALGLLLYGVFCFAEAKYRRGV